MPKAKTDAPAPMAKHRTVIVRSDKGGVGKSTIAALLRTVAMQTGRPDPAVFDADVGSKLAKIWPGDVTSLGLDSVEEIAKNVHDARGKFDPLLDKMLSNDCLIDLGATASRNYSDWSQSLGLAKRYGDKVEFISVIIVTADAVALEMAVVALKAAIREGTKPILVMSEKDGTFNDLDEEDADALKYLTELSELKTKYNIQTLEVPRCDAEGWKKLVIKSIDMVQAAAMSEDDYKKAISKDLARSVRSQLQLKEWVVKSIDILKPVWS